jgi:thermostable 8-oxoguanine DNA glycosylase
MLELRPNCECCDKENEHGLQAGKIKRVNYPTETLTSGNRCEDVISRAIYLNRENIKSLLEFVGSRFPQSRRKIISISAFEFIIQPVAVTLNELKPNTRHSCPA